MPLLVESSLRIESSRYNNGIKDVKTRTVNPSTGHEMPSAIPEIIDRKRCFILGDIYANLIFLKLLQLLYCQKLENF